MDMPGDGRLSRRSLLAAAGAAAAAFSVLPRPAAAAEEPRLAFWNWDTYIGPTTLEDFRAATGISVRMDLFSDAGQLLARLRDGNPGYDVIVPSNDLVGRLIAEDRLMALDQAEIPNRANLLEYFSDAAFDPGRRHSMPYMWGTLGIGYRKSRCDGVPDSWKWLYESDRHAGRLALLSEASTVLAVAFKYLGHSVNATDPEVFRAAEALIIAQKPHVRAFAPDTGQDLLLAGEVDIAMEWNGDILQAMDRDPDISYVVPREGSILWEDALAIPKGAPHPGNAHRFINFILDPATGAAIASAIRYATPNAAAIALLPPEYLENPVIFPRGRVLERCETEIWQGAETARLLEESWARIQAA